MNNKILDVLCVIVGIAGALLVAFGTFQSNANIFYFIGAVFLLLPAIYFKLTYFIALEMILVAGHGAILLGIPPMEQAILPLLLTIQLFIYYLLSGQLAEIFKLIGICGIFLLSLSFSYGNAVTLFLGSAAISIFALHQVFRGRKVALIWVFLNLVFVFITAAQLV